MFVLDASVALAWSIQSQFDATAARAAAAAQSKIPVVPAIWYFETHNVLLSLVHNRKMTELDAANIRSRLLTMQHRADTEPIGVLLPAVWQVARAAGLSFYDATYVELAMRLQVPLATRDRPVIAGAQRMGVALV